MPLSKTSKPIIGLFSIVFVLSACGGGATSSRDMYTGKSGSQITTEARPVISTDTSSSLSTAHARRIEKSKKQATRQEATPQRLAALKEFGLNEAKSPEKLVGLSARELRRVMGEPVFVRRDQGVEVWQYQNAECILDLFLYEKDRALVVDHTELRGPQLNSPSQPGCFSNLLLGIS